MRRVFEGLTHRNLRLLALIVLMIGLALLPFVLPDADEMEPNDERRDPVRAMERDRVPDAPFDPLVPPLESPPPASAQDPDEVSRRLDELFDNPLILQDAAEAVGIEPGDPEPGQPPPAAGPLP